MTSQISSFLKMYGKVFGLLTTMLIGALLPQFYRYTSLMQYLIMAMLFFAFLDIDFKPQMFQKSVLWILLANVAVAFISYMLLRPFDTTFALTAFMTAIAPTATAAPVLISFIQGKIEYVVTAVLLTNIANAVIIPLTLPFLLGADVQISLWQVLQPVMITMFVPLILAWLASYLPSKVQTVVRQGKRSSFLLWMASLFLASANASNFLRNDRADSIFTLVTIALISLALCIINFGVGALLGGRRNWQEASQSLGQKNLAFVIWVALTFINPLVAMGPTFYILYHHLYNSWSIYQFEKRRHAWRHAL